MLAEVGVTIENFCFALDCIWFCNTIVARKVKNRKQMTGETGNYRNKSENASVLLNMAAQAGSDEVKASDEALVRELTNQFAQNTVVAGSLELSGQTVKAEFLTNINMPEAPKEGFADRAQFEAFVQQMNAAVVEDYRQYLQRRDQLRTHDPENPEKFMAEIVTECADGRNTELQFMEGDELLDRFDHEWLPFAGNIIFPEFQELVTAQDWVDYMQKNPGQKEKFFARLDFLFGHKVEEALAEYRQGTLSKVQIEFQSHYDAHHYPRHGCGAHNSNLLAAQLESIKDCLVADSWLAERYPQEYAAGLFSVIHTTHDTSEHGAVYRASVVNETLSAEDKAKYAELFAHSKKKFDPAKVLNEEKGVVREYKGNPFHIELGDHDEQAVRVSNLHYASTLQGQSVMEISWTDSPETLAAHVKILLGIIDNNFRARHPEKPAIVHFDLIKGNEKMADIYGKVRAILDADPELCERVEEGLLLMVLTETDRENYLMEIVR